VRFAPGLLQLAGRHHANGVGGSDVALKIEASACRRAAHHLYSNRVLERVLGVWLIDSSGSR
jgi:hypothetical protein